MKYALVIMGSLAIMTTGCLHIPNPHKGLAPGIWRATLFLEPKLVTPNPKARPLPEKLNIQFEEVTGGELPFTFEVKYENDSVFFIEIINGDERIPAKDISYGHDWSTGDDTILIQFPVFDSYIRAKFEEGVMEGQWVVNNREHYFVPILAKFGQSHRFTTLRKVPLMDITGRWETYFETETEQPFPAIGDFEQKGNHLSGTFLTETGDYRYLEGTIQADKIYLSCFDGSHAFLFEGKVSADSSIQGVFWSGIHYKTFWQAKSNSAFELNDPYKLTFVKTGNQKFDFSLMNKNGEKVTLQDEKFRGKVVLVQIMGTWCPNCLDETRFLLEFIENNPNPSLEIVALAFERHKDTTKAWQSIDRFKEKMKIPYEVLLAGNSDDKALATGSLPSLNKVSAFPTLLFIDKKGEVRKVHTGFSGPATIEYPAFKKEFETFIQELIEEKPN